MARKAGTWYEKRTAPRKKTPQAQDGTEAPTHCVPLCCVTHPQNWTDLQREACLLARQHGPTERLQSLLHTSLIPVTQLPVKAFEVVAPIINIPSLQETPLKVTWEMCSQVLLFYGSERPPHTRTDEALRRNVTSVLNSPHSQHGNRRNRGEHHETCVNRG